MSATEVPAGERIASLKTIDLEKLLAHDGDAARDLVEAAGSPGFFLVDLRGPSSRDFLADIEDVFRISHEYFDQPQDVKNQDDRGSVDRGYKPGSGHETFEIALDELSTDKLCFPDAWERHQAVLTRVIKQSDVMAKTMLRSLAESAGMEADESVRASKSDSGFKFISIPTVARRHEAPDTTHTDTGMLTLLWCPQLSSQILDPRTNEWSWVEPVEGHVLVNVANTLQSMTRGRLHSCVHRVSQPTDRVEKRHMLSYYLRPAATC